MRLIWRLNVLIAARHSSLLFRCLSTFFLPSSETVAGVQYRIARLQEIDSQMLFMVYYGHFDYLGCESMTVREFKTFYLGLVEIQTKEAESLKNIR